MSLFNMDESLATLISILAALPMFGVPLLFYSLGKGPGLATIAILATAGICNNGIGRFFIWKSIAAIGANRGNVLASSQVVFAVALAVGFLNQSFTRYSGTGLMFVLLSVVLLSRGVSSGTPFTSKQLKAGIFYGVVGAFLWGLSQFLMQIGVSQYKDAVMDSFVTYGASLFAALPIMLIVRSTTDNSMKIDKKALVLILLAGILGNLGIFFRYLALASVPLIIVSTVNATNPIATLLLSSMFIRNVEFINRRMVFAIISSTLGLVLMSL